jgi:hypothetical protein
MQWQWSDTIPCKDFAGREKYTQVGATCDGKVAIIAPAGESAQWSAADAVKVQEAIRVALSIVGQGGGV